MWITIFTKHKLEISFLVSRPTDTLISNINYNVSIFQFSFYTIFRVLKIFNFPFDRLKPDRTLSYRNTISYILLNYIFLEFLGFDSLSLKQAVVPKTVTISRSYSIPLTRHRTRPWISISHTYSPGIPFRPEEVSRWTRLGNYIESFGNTRYIGMWNYQVYAQLRYMSSFIVFAFAR